MFDAQDVSDRRHDASGSGSGSRAAPGLVLLLLLSLLAVSACNGSTSTPGGEKIDCNGVERVTLDCRSEFAYDGLEGEIGVDVGGWFGVNADVAETAIREVDKHVETYSAMNTRLCRDYNACILDPQEYRVEAEKIRGHLVEVPTLVEALKKASTAEERLSILDRLYRGVVPEAERDREITFHLSVNAVLPNGEPRIVSAGESLPTGTALFFTVRASTDAYVYMFQVQPSGDMTVLFPEPRIGTTNPLQGKQAKRIPDQNQSFTLTGKPGIERVFFVVSKDAVQPLEEALNKARNQESPHVEDDPLIASIASVVPHEQAASQGCARALTLTTTPAAPPPGATSGCSHPRALTLTGTSAGGGGAEASSLSVRNRPGDDLIVELFQIQHVAPR